MTAQHTPQLEPALVPELLVTNIARSIEFWCGLCGFDLRYSRPEERFAYVVLGSAHLMLEEVGAGRNWITAPLDPPLGRGINFQIGVADAAATAAALTSRGVELFMEPETKWYRTGDSEAGVLQFLVTDPDGYLIRFQSPVGRRALRDTSK
jgi:catechol 2,3-dioxygenase-like lactoylglutathione lyase family enzyme